MQELKNAVATAFDNVVASGAIEKAIQEQIGKCVETAVRDQFGYSGKMTKAINEKVAGLIDVNLDQIDLPSYRDLISKVIQKRVGAVMTTQFTEQLEKDIGEMLEPAPAEITLEQLLEDFVKHQMDQYDASEMRGRDFTLHIDRGDHNDGYVDIYFDKESNKSKYGCDFMIRTKKGGEVWALRLDGDEMKNKLYVGPMYSFEKRLFQMYTAKTKLIIPAEASASDYDSTFPYPGEEY